MHISRRQFLKASGLGLAAVAAGCRGLPAYVAPEVRHAVPAALDELRLVILGDWGSGQPEQWEVAQACDRAADELGGFHAGVFLGDNFYPAGVDSIADPTWVEYFEEVYDTPWLGALTWHAVLGNHDYSGDPRAQIKYSRYSGGRWSMPHFYWRHDFRSTEGEPLLSIVAVDTNKRFAFWDNQLAWLKPTLEELADATWPVIVIGHHPLISNGRHDATYEKRIVLRPLIERTNVQAYFAGHDHNLQLIERDGLAHIVSGGGGKVLHGFTHDEPGTRFKRRDYGFCILFATPDSLRVEFRDRRAEVLFEHVIV